MKLHTVGFCGVDDSVDLPLGDGSKLSHQTTGSRP